MTDQKAPVVGLTEEVRQSWLEKMTPEARLSRALQLDGEAPVYGGAAEGSFGEPEYYGVDLAREGTESVQATLPAAEPVSAELQKAVDNLALAEGFGMLSAFSYLNKFTGLAMTKWLAERKESGDYKGQTVLDRQGRPVTLCNFEQLCEAVGVSRRKADEDIQNLQVLGEELMDKAKGLGLGYRDLRKLRALPEEARQLVIEGEKVGDDPEALKDLLEELAARNAAEKKELKGERDQARRDREAMEKVLQKKNESLDQVQTRLAALENIEPDERLALQGRRGQAAIEELHRQGLMLLGQTGAYLSRLVSILEDQEVSNNCKQLAQDLTSGLCKSFAEDLVANGAEVDFRYLVYPADLGDMPQRDAPGLTPADLEGQS